MFGLLQRASANLKNSSNPAGWSPDDPVPSGFSSHKSRLAVQLSSLGTFSFHSAGHYTQGTVVFERAEQAQAQGAAAANEGRPPTYESHEKLRVVGTVEVTVEARTNSEGLYGECRLEPIEGHERAGLSLSTPATTSVSRLGASLSYHITVSFPADYTALDTLSVETSGFRVILASSLAAVTITTLHLSTADAPIVLSSTRCVDALIKNHNLLDPNRHALKNFEDLVQGSLDASGRIELQCENGPVSGTYTASGAIVARTSNFALRGEFRGASLRLGTVNAELSGRFEARRDVVLSNTHGKVEGTVRAPGGCEVKGQYVAIKGEFEVGTQLKLLTTVFRIDATIRLLAPSSSTVLSPAGAAPVTRVPSTTSTTDLPTFEDALASSASSSAMGLIAVSAETTDAGVELIFPGPVPGECALRATARSSGGSRVAVTHAPGWEGRFSATTSITHTATLTAPAGASVHYDAQRRAEVSGFVGSGAGAGAGDGRNRTTVDGDGEVEIVLL